jgi:hypothetical protein
MSTSGSSQLRAYTAFQMMERALRQAGVPNEKFTSEIIEISFDVFNSMLDEMLNLGMQLWARDLIIVPLYENRTLCPTPPDTSVVIDVQQRTLMRPTPIMVSSNMGGVAALAFDGDLNTACTQISPEGSITATYAASGIEVSCYGINFGMAGAAAWMIEYTRDGTTWVAIDASTADVIPGQWVWRNIDGSPSDAVGWRMRSVDTVSPMVINELYFGNTPSDIPMGPMSKDDWDSTPNKTTPGNPFNYYQERAMPSPNLYVWPRPNAQTKFLSLLVRRRRYLSQVTDMQQTLDVSRRWNEALTSSLARRLCKELPEADLKRFATLKGEEASDLQLAIGEERDPAPVRFNPGLDVYSL